ncbi:MAG TPA: sigma-70 family RNA polymerase sigma factor [Chitinophagaceae bacterium]|nr:sigma-70 family RNA polymerase sigma factor [Chitinophagaceae bacterium]
MTYQDRYAHLTDQELLDNFYSDGNNQWLGALLPRYTLLLLGVCMKYLKNEEEAKDCVQHIFMKAITELPKYKVEYFKAWLYMVARNHCLMRIRSRQGKMPVEIKEQHLAAIYEENELQSHVQKDLLLHDLELALEKLNPEQKQCITLFYLEKKSYQEIAEQTGFTLLQVKSYIQNGKRNLKIMLEKKIQPEK